MSQLLWSNYDSEVLYDKMYLSNKKSKQPPKLY